MLADSERPADSDPPAMTGSAQEAADALQEAEEAAEDARSTLETVRDDVSGAEAALSARREELGAARAALDAQAMRLQAGRDADARAFLLVRPYISTGVRITIDDPGDPTPYWLLSSRRAVELAAALEREPEVRGAPVAR